MKINVQIFQTNLNYFASFKEPLWEPFLENRLPLVKKIISSFGLRLNDIKFNNDSPSDSFIKFHKFINETFLDVNFGMEEVSARIGTPKSEEQVLELYTMLYSLIPPKMVMRQHVSIDRHLSGQDDLSVYLVKLNPNIPKKLVEFQSGNGVLYNLRFQEHDLTVQVMATNSAIIPKGIFLNMTFDFSPNKYDFLDAFYIAKKQYEFILAEMEIEIVTKEV